MLLMPSFMKLMGTANWWAPKPLRAFYDRFGLERNVDPVPVLGSGRECIDGNVPGGRS
ncbi:hypothetical protein KHQ06_09585 [Nocardia tengchongensis]|uniref:Uncharacterized protein n=2 Tax=Nocardia tengchongensis TaxID=2055889 RepID=A0ABX8CVF5_9NOCA|nr:hypothetical protein [Nocardia tengchongensis]QVI23138.1 hypothetical protein KHQ06_09585 [Nocardia tengchongensis]